jgi:DNA-binding response OmpR family regulator
VIGENLEEAPAERPSRQPSPTPAGEDESWPLVLLADDDAVLRKVATKLLRSGGFRVHTVADGKAALDRLSAMNDIALVVSDLHMPAMGGVALLAAIRESDTLANTPVIILTSDDDHAQEVRLIDAGADDYIRKPIDAVRLLSRVRAALRRAQS